MYFDLNISVPPPPAVVNYHKQNKKGKQKPRQGKPIEPPNGSWFSPEQIAAVDSRVEVLVYCTHATSHTSVFSILMFWVCIVGYTVFAFNQSIESAFTGHGHINYLDSLIQQLKPRDGVVYLKRLTILMDDMSDKGTGLVRPPPKCLSQMSFILSF
jgi:ribonuclease P/MRP protein subunit RPP1